MEFSMDIRRSGEKRQQLSTKFCLQHKFIFCELKEKEFFALLRSFTPNVLLVYARVVDVECNKTMKIFQFQRRCVDTRYVTMSFKVTERALDISHLVQHSFNVNHRKFLFFLSNFMIFLFASPYVECFHSLFLPFYYLEACILYKQTKPKLSQPRKKK